MAEKLLSMKTVQSIMGISASSLQRYKKKRIPPFDKLIIITGRVLMSESHYNQWVKNSLSQTVITGED